MSTLTYAKRHLAPARADEKPVREPFWRRLFDAIVASQQRRAEREVARYLATRGDLLNDETEREIMRRLAGDTRRSL
jgi:hypothetical protein